MAKEEAKPSAGQVITSALISQVTTSGHYHSRPLQEAVEQMGEDRVLFSVDYPYEQMSSVARWFDELLISGRIKSQIGRDNASTLLKLALPRYSIQGAAGFGS